MAINKRKVLEAARKFAQKGAKERALKEYNVLLKDDPRDAKLLLEIGDVHRRWGQVDEAVAQYSRVADQYKQEGFDARAVAVYKQILNLDAKRFAAHVSLSELYQRMGLDAEAVVSLQTAADGYHKEGKKREALDLLRRMATLDPSNTTSRMKVADLLHQEGMDDDAVAEYEGVVAELERQGALDAVTAVYERILEIRPNNIEVLTGLARSLIAQGQPERAEPFARRVCDADPDVPEHCELLIDVFKALGRDDDLNAATREVAKLYRARGDEERAREILQRLPSVDSFELSGVQPALQTEADDPLADFETEAPPDLGAPGILGDEDSFIGDETGALLDDDELLDDDFLMEDGGLGGEVGMGADEAPSDEAAAPLDAGVEPAPASPPPLEGDPDQLFAEASVYLRYGKRDQAIESLRSILGSVPEHRPALEKLGEAYAEGGADSEAVRVWTEAALLAQTEGDTSSFGILCDRIRSLDPDAAEALAPAADAEPGDEFDIDVDLDLPPEDRNDLAEETVAGGDAEYDSGFDDEEPSAAESAIDFDVDVDVDIEIEGEDRTESIHVAEDDGGFDFADASGEFEIDLDDDAGESPDLDVANESDEVEIALDLDDDETGVEIDADTGIDLDGEGGDTLVGAEEDGPSADPGVSRPESGSATTAAKVAEDLEEAEFYFQQQLFDEAEAIYRRVLSVAPNHPSALLRMGEMAVERGGDPSDPTGEPALATNPDVAKETPLSDALSDPTMGDLEVAAAGEIELDLDLDGAGDSEASEADTPEEVALDSAAGDLEAESESGLDLASAAAPLSSGDEAPEAYSLESETAPLEDASDGAAWAEPTTLVDEPSAVANDRDEPFVPTPTRSDETLPVEPVNAEAPLAFAAAGVEEEEGGFDLAAELAGSFDDDDDANSVSQNEMVLSDVENGFESIFSDFKKGVSQQLGEGDLETRYDLGIAYMEMGLHEDAIAEFQLCVGSDGRHIESLHMISLCALQLGRMQDAVQHLEQALAVPDVPAEVRPGLYFDLGRALQQAGETARAREAYETVQAGDPAFPGIAAQIASLDEGAAPAEADDDGLESFEGFLADLDSGGGDEAELEGGDADASPDDSLSRSKKKKISFV